MGPSPASLEHLGGTESWSVDRVLEWLASMDLSHLMGVFREHRITGDVLLDLSSDDLAEVGVHALGDKKRLLRAIASLRGVRVPQNEPVCYFQTSQDCQQWGCTSPMPSETYQMPGVQGSHGQNF